MKRILFFSFLFALTTFKAFSQTSFSISGIQSNFTSPVPANPLNVAGEIFRFNSTATNTSNFFTQYFNGALPIGSVGFGLNDRWISSGQIVPPSTQVLQGYRTQRNGRSLIIALDGSSTTNTPDPVIQWGGNSTVSVTPGDLLFRNFTSPNSTTPDQVLRLKSNGKMVLGKVELASNFLAEIDASDNPAISGGMLIDVKNITLSGSPIGLQTIVTGAGAAGIVASANGANFNGSSTGISASATGTGTSIGVVGVASSGNTRFGIFGSAGSGGFAGYFAGNVFATGTITSSDEKLKTTIEPETGLQKLMQLKPVSFYYNKAAIADLNMPSTFQHGFIAQDMEKIFPELVMEVKAPIFKTDAANGAFTVDRIETFKGINYTSIISVLTKSVQEQQYMIDALNQKIDQMQMVSKTATASSNGYMLSQNVPNPFTSNTIISYQLPANSGNAILGVFDLTGKMLLQYNLAKAGNQISISGSSLAAGMYIYSLIVNGNEVASKKMVLTK